MDISKVSPETAKQVKKELLKHLVKAMDEQTSGKMKKPAPVAEKTEPKQDPKSKAAHTCPECDKAPCECEDMGGETASEEVAEPKDKLSMKAKLRALIAKKGE